MWPGHSRSPADTQALHYVFTLAPPGAAAQQAGVQVFLDGALLVAGNFPTDTPPVFADNAASTGTWGGQPFTNLLRNASAEQSWLRIRPWVETTITSVVSVGWGRSLSQLLASLGDPARSSDILVRYVGLAPIEGLFTRLAWGNIAISTPPILALCWLVTGGALVGGGLWLARTARQPDTRPLLAIVLVLALALLLSWGGMALRAFPQISEGLVRPVTRYTFPVAVITALVLAGGWWTLAPPASARQPGGTGRAGWGAQSGFDWYGVDVLSIVLSHASPACWQHRSGAAHELYKEQTR
ncbi:MAG: hypothetical protein HC876_06820 [Chloroflexaceae bacterium]|nr:hypothetical protein [Chloroflexaceae bacterium]